ncbi:hypothetical protein N2152v2_007676 [Parachlorella kessleri]
MGDFDDEFGDLAIPNCTLRWEVELPESTIALALSPKEQLVAVGTVEDEICLLDVATGEVKFRLAGHDGGTNAVAFLSGNTLVSAGEDGKTRVWNVGRQSCIHELAIDAVEPDTSPSGFSVSHLAVAPDASSFAVAAGKSVVRFSLDSQQGPSAEPKRKAFPPLASTVEALRFDRQGNLMAAYYGGVTYWDFSRTEEQRQALDLPYQGACLSLDATPTADWVVAGCHDSSVHIYHFKRQEEAGVELEEMQCGGYEGKVTLVDFDRRGRHMASAGGERNIVWDFSKTPAGSLPTLTFGHRKPISCQGWQPDGDLLATGGRDGRIYLYDVADAMPNRDGPSMCLPGALADRMGDEVTQLRWASNGRILAGYLSGFVRLWELPVAESSEEEEEEAEGTGSGDTAPAAAGSSSREGAARSGTEAAAGSS